MFVGFQNHHGGKMVVQKLFRQEAARSTEQTTISHDTLRDAPKPASGRGDRRSGSVTNVSPGRPFSLEWQLCAVDSTDQRNTLSELFSWRLILQGLAGSFIYLSCNCTQFCL
jgi:hypothetical protein